MITETKSSIEIEKKNTKDRPLIYKDTEKIYGTVFNIQRYSLQDGPGIRTSIFLKGCPLKCIWCCNPESQKSGKELMYYNEKCIKCLNCVNSCPIRAISFEEQSIKINRKLCNLCGKCVEVCPQGAYSVVGEKMSVSDVINEVLRDFPFYNYSAGGVTLTGGEPSYQAEFSSLILKSFKQERIHTAIETCGYAKWRNFEKILQYTDLVLFDLKIMSDEKSKELLGVSNNIILHNIKKIDELGLKTIIRMPLIPNYNDSEENLKEMAKFLKGLKRLYPIEIIPFHQHGRSKYKALGRNYLLEEMEQMHNEDAKSVVDFLKNRGFKVKII